MKGLLYKDWVILRKQGKAYLFIIFIFAAIPQFSRMGFATAYAAILPYTIIAYDEQSKWNRLAIMLPYTDGQLVLSKYIFSWLGMLLVLVISAISRTADYFINGQTVLINEYQEVILLTAASALFSAAMLPLVFRFGVERGRLAFIPVVVGGVIAVVVAGERIAPHLHTISLWAVVLIAILIAATANILSVRLSRKLFRRGLCA